MNAQAERPESSVDRKLLEILVCPLTKGPLEFDATKQELVSRSAKLAYPIRDGIVDKILETEILDPSELRLPAVGAAFVVAERGNAARAESVGKLLQRRRFDLRPVAVVVGGAGAGDQQRDRRARDLRGCGEDGVDGGNAELRLLSGSVHNKDSDNQGDRAKNRRRAH